MIRKELLYSNRLTTLGSRETNIREILRKRSNTFSSFVKSTRLKLRDPIRCHVVQCDFMTMYQAQQIACWCKGEVLAEVLREPVGHKCVHARNNKKLLCGQCARVFGEKSEMTDAMTRIKPFMEAINALDEQCPHMPQYIRLYPEIKDEVKNAWEQATYEQEQDVRPVNLQERRRSRSRSHRKDVVTQVIQMLPDMDGKDLRFLTQEAYREFMMRVVNRKDDA